MALYSTMQSLFRVLLFNIFFLSSIHSLAIARNSQITITGSSTVYPFALIVADRFSASTPYSAPIITSNGTGGGFRLFCSGVDLRTADINLASRSIKDSEIATCNKNNVTKIIEIKIGSDALILVTSKDKGFSVTKLELFKALAAKLPDQNNRLVDNQYEYWSDINSNLPRAKIIVYGPSATSGTRDVFLEDVMESGSLEIDYFKVLKKEDKNKFKALTHDLRIDGWVDSGENDNIIIQKVSKSNEYAIGILGYSYFLSSIDFLDALSVEGVDPSNNIKDYPLTRPLYAYVKAQHMNIKKGLNELSQAFVADEAIGENGYLLDRGLISPSKQELKRARREIESFIES